MNALLILTIAGFTALFSAISFKRASVIEQATNVNPNYLLFSVEELTGAGIVFGIAAAILVVLAIAVAVTGRR